MSKFLKKGLKGLFYLLAGTILIVLVYLNCRLYYSPTYIDIEQNGQVINKDALQQLRYLQAYLKEGGGQDAQAKYPEGFVFLNALYGLTWCDFIAKLPQKSSLHKEGLKEIDWALQQLNSDYAKMWFPNEINPSNGIFYMGWKNYLLARKIVLQNPSEWTISDTLLLAEQSEVIYRAFGASKQTYLESYSEGVWPADNIVAVASLSLYKQLGNNRKYDKFVLAWIKKVKTKLDPMTGLIPHEVAFKTGQTKEGARGSSQSLILNFLIDIDSTFAKQQFALYKEQFLDYRFGLPGIREYPKGATGIEDVDSGPILLGIGGAASLVGQRTMALYNASTVSIGLRNSIESFGLAYTTKEQKYYVLGMEPIADAFIAWANVVNVQKVEKQTGNWRWTFQFLSLALLFVITWYNMVNKIENSLTSTAIII